MKNKEVEIKFKGAKIDERVNLIKRHGEILLLSLIKLEGSLKVEKQGYDLLGRHQKFQWSLGVTKIDARYIIDEFRKERKDNDFGLTIETKIFTTPDESRDYRDHKEVMFIGKDITVLLLDALDNRDEVGVFTTVKGRVSLRMSKSFAEARGYGKYEFLIKGASISSSLGTSKKSVRFSYELHLNPLAVAMLAKHIWYINKLLAKRMLLYAGDYMDTTLQLDKNGKIYEFRNQSVRGSNQ